MCINNVCDTNASNEELVSLIQENLHKGLSIKEYMWRLYEKNKRLIYKLSSRYFAVGGYDSREDVLQEAYIALHMAAEHYSKDCGVLFMSYYPFWLKNRMREYISCIYPVRTPITVQDIIIKYNKIMNEYYTKYGTIPNDYIIADALNITDSRLKEIKECMKLMQIASTDTKLTDDADADTLIDMVVDDNTSIEEHAEIQEQIDCVADALAELNDIEYDVIKHRYFDELSIRATANVLGMAADKVRRIESCAIKKIRNNKHIKGLATEYGYYREYREITKDYSLLDARLNRIAVR